MVKKQEKNNFNAYTKAVLKRFTNPQHFGEIKNPDGVGQVGNPQCGDIMKIYLKVKDNKIKDIKFQTFGCVSAIASSEALCEIAKGKTIEQAKKISNQKIVDKLEGLPSVKVHCSVLGSSGLKKAILDYEMKHGKSSFKKDLGEKLYKKELEKLDKEANGEHH
ncbi:iron-sulfur cluster assembly scaffold protein [Candidatus Pacearchaeota archaeon]|nr:iron-sulfur cluster assembly scaffold protein [Candidatus Pacearchaeota archaeon]